MAREKQAGPAGERRLEQYGVWVKVEPREVDEPADAEGPFALSDLEAPKGEDKSGALTQEEEELLDELETELEPDAGEASIPEEEPLLSEAEELPDIALETEAELEIETEEPTVGKRATSGPEEIEVTLSEGPVEEHFDDLKALEDELATVPSAETKTGSTEILARIEEELRSIRSDLADLKKQLETMRAAGPEPSEVQPKAETEAKGGFFDEEEDETIALTGDELDNILNTAEITEEPAEIPGGSMDLPAAAPTAPPSSEAEQNDIIGYGDILMEEPLPAPAAGKAEPEAPPSPVEDLASQEDDSEDLTIKDLDAEFVIEETAEPVAPPDEPFAAGAGSLPELDLEALPEVEDDAEAETAELLEDAPELEAIAAEEKPLEDATELEAIAAEEKPLDIEPVEEPLGELEALSEEEEPGSEGPAAAAEEIAVDVDLEALAVHAEDLEEAAPSLPSIDDLDIGELEAVTDEPEEVAESPQKEIEISFEGEEEPVAALPEAEEPAPRREVPAHPPAPASPSAIPEDLKDELRAVLKYMDHLLEALPDEKIQEFANSEYFTMYKKLFEDLGLGE